jgi:hypothetical protein
MKNFKQLLNRILKENEGAIANSVSSGGIYGVRGNPDETIVHQMAHLKRMKKEKKKKPVFLRIATSNDPY